jgi:hypothetical protein
MLDILFMTRKKILIYNEIKLQFMDLIFFLQRMSLADVKIERYGFMLSNQITHTHLTYDTDELNFITSELARLKLFILQTHEYNKQHINTKTHEELKSLNLSNAEFLTQGGGNKAILSQAQREEYLAVIKTLQ